MAEILRRGNTPAIVWGVFILLMSVLPSGSAIPGGTDKILHFGAYCVLSLLIAAGTRRSDPPGILTVPAALLILIITGGYGMVIELIQDVLPWREASVGDILANFSGAFTGTLAGKILPWRK